MLIFGSGRHEAAYRPAISRARSVLPHVFACAQAVAWGWATFSPSEKPMTVPRALTIAQPWATLIIEGHKDFENRTWAPPRYIREQVWLGIHAGKMWSQVGADMAAKLGIDVPGRNEIAAGYLLGFARLVEVVRHSDSVWYQGPYGWRLADPRPLPVPIRMHGRQGIWCVPYRRDVSTFFAALPAPQKGDE